MLTRLASVSKNETYRPTLGISMGSPSTSPPASVTRRIAASTSSTERTTHGYCAGQSGFLRKKPPLIAQGLSGRARSFRWSWQGHSCPSPPQASGSASQIRLGRTSPCARDRRRAFRSVRQSSFCSWWGLLPIVRDVAGSKRRRLRFTLPRVHWLDAFIIQQSYEPDRSLSASRLGIPPPSGAWLACVSKGLGFNADQGSRSDIFQFAKQHPEVAFRGPIASHDQLHREIVKQLIERRLNATLIEHDFLPLRFHPGSQLASLRPCGCCRSNAAPGRSSAKKSEIV